MFRPQAIIFTLLAALTVGGCASIPSTGFVSSGGAIGSNLGNSLEFLAAGPAKGATALEIVQGFIEAGKATQNNYLTARSFMTIDMGAEWDPVAETLVTDKFEFFEKDTAEGKVIQLSVTPNLVVDSVGHLEPETSDSPVTIEFKLTQVDGEWRISSAPNQTILTNTDFLTTFGQYPIYYFAEDGKTLVPDVRVFAIHNDLVATIARAVMSAPDPSLYSNVYSFFQPDDQLSFTPGKATELEAPIELRSVSISDGVANIDVSKNLLDVSLSSRALMTNALNASLKGIQNIAEVKISTGGGVPAVDNTIQTIIEPQIDDRPLVISNGTFGYATANNLEKITTVSDQVSSLKPNAVSINGPGQVAASNNEGVYVIRNGVVKKIFAGSSIGTPQIDSSGSIWWIDTKLPDQIQLYSKNFTQTLESGWPVSGRIAAMEISREGSRIAVAIKKGQRSFVYVGSVSRDSEGNPLFISGFKQIAVFSELVDDVAWADSSHLAILGYQGGKQIVEYANVGGTSDIIGWSMSGVEITGGNNGKSGIQLLLTNGELWTPLGTGWESKQIKADLLATQF